MRVCPSRTDDGERKREREREKGASDSAEAIIIPHKIDTLALILSHIFKFKFNLL